MKERDRKLTCREKEPEKERKLQNIVLKDCKETYRDTHWEFTVSMENHSRSLRSVWFVYKNSEHNYLLFGKSYTTFGGLFVPASLGVSKKLMAYLVLFLSMSASHDSFFYIMKIRVQITVLYVWST